MIGRTVRHSCLRQNGMVCKLCGMCFRRILWLGRHTKQKKWTINNSTKCQEKLRHSNNYIHEYINTNPIPLHWISSELSKQTSYSSFTVTLVCHLCVFMYYLFVFLPFSVESLSSLSLWTAARPNCPTTKRSCTRHQSISINFVWRSIRWLWGSLVQCRFIAVSRH